LLFVSFITSTFEFNSTTLARERRAVAQGGQLGPGDLRVKAASSRSRFRRDVFSADEFSEGDDASATSSGCSTSSVG
jgi:hypothetical protein